MCACTLETKIYVTWFAAQNGFITNFAFELTYILTCIIKFAYITLYQSAFTRALVVRVHVQLVYFELVN